MNNFLDDVLRHQKMIDSVLGHSDLARVMQQASTAELVAQRYGDYDRLLGGTGIAQAIRTMNLGNALTDPYSSLGIARHLASLAVPQLSYTQKLAEEIERASAAAMSLRAVAHLPGGIAEYAHDDALRSLTRWHEFIDRSPAQIALEAMQMSASNVAAMHLGSSTRAFEREIAAARDMMFRPEWGVLHDQLFRNFDAQYAHLFDTNSLYRELLQRMEQWDEMAAVSAEEEAEDYFQAIAAFLTQHFKKLSPHDLLAIVHLLIGIVFHIHLAHELSAGLEEVKADIARAKTEVNAHTSAVVDALWAKLEPKFAELAAAREASKSRKWMARDSLVVVRRTPESGARAVGVLLPAQVATQMDHRGKWVQIEFHDHKAGVPKIGWAMKKHLDRIEGGDKPN